MIIAITGTPGVGKSIVAKKVCKLIGYNYLDLNGLIKKNRLYTGYDKKRKSFVVDIAKLKKKIKVEENTIFDGHLSHFLKSDKVFVLRCAPNVLAKRLGNKRWSKAKVEENMEAELIGVIATESRERHKKVYDIDTTRKSPSGVARLIANVIKNRSQGSRKIIDWIK